MSVYFEPAQTASLASLQYGSVTFGINDTTKTATVSAVDTTKSSLMLLGYSTPELNAARPIVDMCRIALTNSTTVTATRNSSGATALTVNFVILTWSNPVSIQASSITIANLATSNTATITAVNVARAVLFWLGQECADNTIGNADFGALTLTNSTTITASRGGTNLALIVGFVVVEL